MTAIALPIDLAALGDVPMRHIAQVLAAAGLGIETHDGQTVVTTGMPQVRTAEARRAAAW